MRSVARQVLSEGWEGAREDDVLEDARERKRARGKAKGNVIHERNIVVTNVQRRMEGRVEMREGGWYGVVWSR